LPAFVAKKIGMETAEEAKYQIIKNYCIQYGHD